LIRLATVNAADDNKKNSSAKLVQKRIGRADIGLNNVFFDGSMNEDSPFSKASKAGLPIG